MSRTLASLLCLMSATMAQAQQFSVEKTGRVANSWVQLVKTSRTICESRGESFRVEGNPSRAGDTRSKLYVSGVRSAVMANRWIMVYAQPNDPCVLRVLEEEETRYEAIEGNVVERVTVPEPPKKARATRSPATVDMIDPSLAGRTARALAGGFTRSGTASFAGYACDMFGKLDDAGQWELCLLNDPAAPPFVQGLPLHDAIIMNGQDGKPSYTTVISLDFTTPIDPDKVEPPKNVPRAGAR